MTKREKTEKEIMEKVRGKKLDTPICRIRVFHIEDPSYTYQFVRQEGSEVKVVDDNNETESTEKRLAFFPANDLVNVVVFQYALLDSVTTPVPRKK